MTGRNPGELRKMGKELSTFDPEVSSEDAPSNPINVLPRH